MTFIKNLFLIFKVLIITFFFTLIIDFFFGQKILNQFDSFFLKSQFGEKLVRIDHPVYHHTLRENIVYSSNVSFIGTYELCTNNFGFKSKCNQVDKKDYQFAFIGDSFTEGTPIEYDDTFVGLFSEKTGYKTANLGIASYSPKIYLSKLNFLINEGFKFNHVIIFIDISDFYDDTNFYSINEELIVSQKNSRKKSLKRKKFLRKNFPLTNFYMYVLRKYKIKENKLIQIPKDTMPIFNEKTNLKAKWTYSKTDKLEGYEIGISEGNKNMTEQMIKLYDILKKNNIDMSLAIYPWPHQLNNDVEDSIHVKIWEDFCKKRCENFINYFPIFFDKMNKSSYLETYNKYYFQNDPHFNKEGHKVLANKLVEIFK